MVFTNEREFRIWLRRRIYESYDNAAAFCRAHNIRQDYLCNYFRNRIGGHTLEKLILQALGLRKKTTITSIISVKKV